MTGGVEGGRKGYSSQEVQRQKLFCLYTLILQKVNYLQSILPPTGKRYFSDNWGKSNMKSVLDAVDFVGWGNGVMAVFLKSYLLEIQPEIFMGKTTRWLRFSESCRRKHLCMFVERGL